MGKFRRGWQIFMDILEVYVPSVSIITLFVAFILQIFSRYALRAPMIWPYEVAQVSYVFAIMLGTCYAERHQENIAFTVLYDALGPRMKKLFDLINAFLVVGVLAYSLYSLVGFYSFFMTRYSVVLKLPLGIVYFPYVPFVLITICRFARRFIHALRTPAHILCAGHGVSQSEEDPHE